REVFALLGQERLFRMARPLRIEAPLRRVSSVLGRQGWRAVFTARLIPGLRVYTTQVAGVIRMPRRTFVAGLVPAAAVYVAAFVGLGAAVGRPILELIRRGEYQLLVVVLPLAGAAALVLLLRGPALRLLASLLPAARAGAWVLRLDSPGIILIPAAIGLNFTGHALATELKLPLFLDSIGTVLSALLAGPWVAAGVGLVT